MYCITHYNGEKLRYLTGVFSSTERGKYVWTENKNIAYTYEKKEHADIIAGYFPGSIVEEFKK